MIDHADRVGQQIGDYRLLRRLGGGGFGDVYLGEHIYEQTQAAIKILQASLTCSEEWREFINEARTMRLKHPHIISLLDFGIGSDGTPFLVMAYAPNGTLRDRHPKGSRLPLATIVSYVSSLASALHYAHTFRLVHRDVKPENMLVGPKHEILLSDFGIATVAQSSRSLDKEQGIGGTLPYMAPEQIVGKPRAASDQYALGIVVYEWIMGRQPFKGTAIELVMQHAMTPPPSLREQIPTLSMAVERVVLTALAKDPKQRFADIEEFAGALKEASQQVEMARQLPEHPLSIVSSLPYDLALARHPINQVDVVGHETMKSIRESAFPISTSRVERSQHVDGFLPLPIVTSTASTLSKQEQPSPRSPYPPTTWIFQSPRRKRPSMRTAVLLLVLTFLILAGGGSLYASVNLSTAQMQVKNQRPTPTLSTSTRPLTATPMPGGVNVLAKDSFERAAQTFWGTASDGRLWQGDANSVEVFSIKGGAGQIDHGQGAFNAVLGSVSANAEVLFTSSVNHFTNNGIVNTGAMLRWVDGNNWYKAFIDGVHLQLFSRINGTTRSLATMPFPAQDGLSYTLRFRVVGANLFAKVWPANQPEPAAWMVTVTDTALTQGMGGIRVLLQNTTVIRVTSFLETTVGNTV